MVVDGFCSKTCNVVSGVPQWSVLGPPLILLYINNLPQHLELQCRLFEDDAAIYNTRNNSLVLSKDLQQCFKWIGSDRRVCNIKTFSFFSTGLLNR